MSRSACYYHLYAKKKKAHLSVGCTIKSNRPAVFVAVTGKISKSSNEAQRSWIEKIETRLRLTSSMLGDMKAVKTLGMSDEMFSIIQAMRLDEIKTSHRFRKLLVWQILICLLFPSRRSFIDSEELTKWSIIQPIIHHFLFQSLLSLFTLA